MSSTITITFGDRAENHRGMEMIGDMAERGFTLSELVTARKWFARRGVKSKIEFIHQALPEEYRHLVKPAYVLIVEGGVDCILNEIGKDKKDFFEEQVSLEWDKKAKMYGRVVDKHVRWNLCYKEEASEPDYDQGKGRYYAFKDLECLDHVRNTLPSIFGESGKNLVAEGNYYHDPDQCGIGYHGDSERRKVVGIRLGKEFSLYYQWFFHSEPIGERREYMLPPGTFYVMGEGAAGTNWTREKKIPTLRHAAGEKYKIPKSKPKKNSDKK